MSLSLIYSYFLGIRAFTPGGRGSRAEENDVAEGVELTELGQLAKLVRLKRPFQGCMCCTSALGEDWWRCSQAEWKRQLHSSTAFCVIAHIIAHTQYGLFRERSVKSLHAPLRSPGLHAPLRSPGKFTNLPN